MNFNTDRIARLSGLISGDEYKGNALNESAQRVTEAEEDDNNPKFEEADEEDEDKREEKIEGDTVEEAKLRKIIRREVSQLLDEVIATRETKQLQHAQKTRSVGAAMGFMGVGFGPLNPDRNRWK